MGWAYPNLVGLGNGKACVFDQPETPGETRLYCEKRIAIPLLTCKDYQWKPRCLLYQLWLEVVNHDSRQLIK